ncbi:MAG TPA: hypothetical protein VHB46_14980 [Burkholderiales bacterium]|nr:hypothetical protein [Burkholderiales bacterium]
MSGLVTLAQPLAMAAVNASAVILPIFIRKPDMNIRFSARRKPPVGQAGASR